ncbi:GNAT family N-acetyltransferase [Haladaptatus caseinilyticus]|uniref:GNAT family N-acetyltransferase n=1 Tax=Haladaptatus caseinilyticus TaxID=2993314 RepID=UPI00224B2BE1|nr:GNAT family N-acetyltransferase [Haladaptatus caseinilyticus]
MRIQIRPAEPTHIDGVQRVADRAWRSAHESIVGAETVDEFLTKYYDSESFLSLIANDDAVFAVAARNDRDIVGFVSATPDDDCSARYHLGRIYIHPEQWGKGVGQRLLQYAEQCIEARDGKRITLGVMAENERAISFYGSAGYERASEFYDERIDTRGYEYRKSI